MELAGRAELGAGNDCCCEEKLLSGTNEGICQGWFDASEELETEAAGAEKARATAGGGFLDTKGCAPEAYGVMLASTETNCLIFSLAFAFKAASSSADCEFCGTGASVKGGRIAG